MTVDVCDFDGDTIFVFGARQFILILLLLPPSPLIGTFKLMNNNYNSNLIFY
jgi:hypothetical protein